MFNTIYGFLDKVIRKLIMKFIPTPHGKEKTIFLSFKLIQFIWIWFLHGFPSQVPAPELRPLHIRSTCFRRKILIPVSTREECICDFCFPGNFHYSCYLLCWQDTQIFMRCSRVTFITKTAKTIQQMHASTSLHGYPFPRHRTSWPKLFILDQRRVCHLPRTHTHSRTRYFQYMATMQLSLPLFCAS